MFTLILILKMFIQFHDFECLLTFAASHVIVWVINKGDDPVKVMGKSARAIAERFIPTFGSFADDYLAAHGPKFRNEKHKAQWTMTLTTYCASIRSKPVNEIDMT